MTLMKQPAAFRLASVRGQALTRIISSVLIGAMVTGASMIPSRASADEGAYVPQFSLAALKVRVADVLASETMKMLPTEVAVAWSQEHFGFDPTTIDEIKIVAGMPMGPGSPPVGALVQLSEPYDPSNIDGQYLGEEGTRSVSGLDVTVISFEGEEFYLAMVDSKTALLTTPIMFQAMAATPVGEGALAQLLVDNPIGEQKIQLALSVESARPMIEPMVGQMSRNLPPELSDLSRVPGLIDGLIVSADANPMTTGLKAEILAGDAAKATDLQEILVRSIEFGRAMFVSKMQQEIREEGPIADAQRAYAARLANHYAETATPIQNGDRLELVALQDANVAMTGVMVGLLMPAVQSARGAARRMSGSNNMKQIGLAMHNHHAAFRNLPGPAKQDAAGKPLLSWRVMVLPFIEQQELYEQFHLDEPWDSDHNIKLLDQMPAVYRNPGSVTEPNTTVYQAVVGDDFMFNPEGDNRFRNVLDGLSNTIMVVETSQENAVPWTKPVDVDFDADSFLENMGDTTPGGFHILMGDGAVRFISENIDEGLFNALLTRAGKEVINQAF